MLRMANEGEWRPVLEFLSEEIARQTGIRDYIGGEKVLAPRAGALGFLAAYLSVADYYVFFDRRRSWGKDTRTSPWSR